MFKRFASGLAAVAMLATVGQPVYAFGFKKKCCKPACEPACNTCVTYKDVERTIMVPTTVCETRKVTVCEYKTEQRERTIKVCKMVRETKQVTRECTIMVPETRTRTVKYCVSKPVWKEETRECTVMVPHTEKRQGTRTVCKLVPTKVMKTVCEDRGCWKTECYVKKHKKCVDECGNCVLKPVVRTRKVWCPNIVTRQVETCVMKRVNECVPYEYCVTVCKPEKRTRKVRTCHYVKEEKTRECNYTVCVPKKQTRTCNVTVCKPVMEERVQKYCVRVPHQVEKEIQVRVCKMVAKTITCKVACPAPSCDPCCN